jgi:hypothetical protein
MSRDFEYTVRETVNELADEVRTVNLSAAAIRQGRKMVARRRVLAGAAAFACVAALVVPFALFTTRDEGEERVGGQAEPPAVTVAPRSSPATATPVPAVPAIPSSGRRAVLMPGVHAITVIGDWIVATAPFDNGSLVYDHTTKRYVELSFHTPVPAPTGSLVAVTAKGMVGTVDLRRPDKVNWVKSAPVVGGVDWAPDGSRFVFVGEGDDPGSVRLNLVEAKSATLVSRPVGDQVVCASDCSPSWSPRGDEVGIADAHGVLHTYSVATGQQVGGLAVPGPVPAGHSWSPKGGMVVTRVLKGTEIVKTDGETGVAVLTLPEYADGIYWLSDELLLSVGNAGVSIYALDGTRQALAPLPTLKFGGAEDLTLGRL